MKNKQINNIDGFIFILPFAVVIALIIGNIAGYLIETYSLENKYQTPLAAISAVIIGGSTPDTVIIGNTSNNTIVNIGSKNSTNDSNTPEIITVGNENKPNTVILGDSNSLNNNQGITVGNTVQPSTIQIGSQNTETTNNKGITVGNENKPNTVILGDSNSLNNNQGITVGNTVQPSTIQIGSQNTETTNNTDSETKSNFLSGNNSTASETAKKITTPVYPIDNEAQIAIQNTDLLYEIVVKSTRAQKVELYLQKENTITPLYLGAAIFDKNNVWKYSFSGQNYPNGSYGLYGLLTETNGIFQTPTINFSISKIINSEQTKSDAAQTVQTMTVHLDAVKQQLDSIYKNIDQTSESAAKEINETLNPQEAEKVNSNINDLIKTIQTVEQLKDLLVQKQTQRNILSQEIVALQIQYQNLPSNALDSIRQDLLAQISDKQNQKDRLDSDIQTIQEAINQKNSEKSSLSLEIIDLTKTLDKNTAGILTDIENSVVQNQQIANDLLNKLQQDSDGDGLNDYEEIYIYHTNPINPDSDDDGFLDGDEVAHSFDPLKPGDHKNAVSIAYQDPRTVPPRQTNLYRIDSVQSVKIAGGTGIKLQGQGLPNSFITLFIYSQPVIVVVKTDSAGRWEYVLDKPLTDGQHTVFAAQTDSAGLIVARSQEFVFLKNGDNVAQTISSNSVIGTSTAKQLESNFKFYTIFAIVLTMMIALLIIGFTARAKNNI